MNKTLKRFLLWLLVVCAVTLVLCTIYYIFHPEEADVGIVSTIDSLDNA
ncbi:MAG: hypothetical protein HDQ87_07195 [Clostridia bacterium]|nr:hypothetical protein [Clostridia bacterium]